MEELRLHSCCSCGEKSGASSGSPKLCELCLWRQPAFILTPGESEATSYAERVDFEAEF